MGMWHEDYWESAVQSGMPRRERRSGAYRWYEPDRLQDRPILIDGALSRAIATAERAIRRLNGPGADVLAAISRFLLRSEAIASSRIEGVSPSSKQVALAELATAEEVRGLSEQARLVANNLTVVSDATTRLVDADSVTVEDIETLHRALLPDEPQQHGLRTVQNWIGGANHHPIDADFVPPRADLVRPLMLDLVGALNGAAESPLVQAALIHAQFETIHPFTDGNGRVGRALIHTVLARRGLTPTAVLPVSLVLATRREEYVEGLAAYRSDAAPVDPDVVAGTAAWVRVFVSAVLDAADQSALIVEDIGRVQEAWRRRLGEHRSGLGLRAWPRSDSATARILEMLPAAPVLTSRTVQVMLDVSPKAALDALDELHHADILATKRIARGATAYLADELLDLITYAERRLASTRFDTRISPPIRSAPARPSHE